MNCLSAKDRKSLIRLASSMPQGSGERKAILAGLKKVSRDPSPGTFFLWYYDSRGRKTTVIDSIGTYIPDLKSAWKAKRKLNRNYKEQGTILEVGEILDDGKTLRHYKSSRDPNKYEDMRW